MALGIYRHFLCLCALFASSAATGDDTNTVVVTGERRERIQPRQSGRSAIIRPDEASRFDTSKQLKFDSSITLPDSGRVTASGFSIPRMRGQDARLSEVYFEEILLQDPYSGLPLVDEIDLRAFGELQIYHGLPPPHLATTSSFGAMRYQPLAPARSTTMVGSSMGQPHGVSGWVLSDTVDESKWLRLYGRDHVTNGRYAFYSDNGTPYNESDDAVIWRENNDRRARQLVPLLKYSDDVQTFTVLGWWHEEIQGIAARPPVTQSFARDRSRGSLASVNWQRDLAPSFWLVPSRLSIGGAGTGESRITEDKTQTVLVNAQERRFALTSKILRGRAEWEFESTHWFFSHEGASARIENTARESQTIRASRRSSYTYAGLEARMPAMISVEPRFSLRRFDDHVDEYRNDDPTSAQIPGTLQRTARGAGVSASYRPPLGIFYGQLARNERPPSILEQFGDGGQTHASPDLKNETTSHEELGAVLRISGDLRLTGAIFRSRTRDRITFLAANGNAFKAVNLESTTIEGAEVAGDYTWETGRVSLAGTRLEPLENRTDGLKRILPFISQNQVALEIEQKVLRTTVRTSSRYRSESYRDSANAVAIPGAVIHDASVDFRRKFLASEFQVGLSVTNIFDTKVLAVAARGTAENRGKTGYSDVEGQPLPGRQLKADVTVKF